ncbi:hypothetical protein Tco_1282487 [Tanacetum coccineum]
MKSSFLNYEEIELQQLQERQTNTRKDCSVYFELFKKHSKYLQNIQWFACTGIEEGFKQAIKRYFGGNHDTFRQKLSYNINSLQRQLAVSQSEFGIEDKKHDPGDALHNLSQPLKFLIN